MPVEDETRMEAYELQESLRATSCHSISASLAMGPKDDAYLRSLCALRCSDPRVQDVRSGICASTASNNASCLRNN